MGRRSKYTKELLEKVVNVSRNMTEVLKNLGLKPIGGNFRNISDHIRHNEVSTAHFETERHGWARGKTKLTDERVAKCARGRSLTNEEIFVENAPPIQGNRIGRRLVELGWEYKCSICGLSDWLGKTITLHLDHINGVGNDNRIENLRFLCPNCHQQTETWGYSNRKGKALQPNANRCVDCGTEIHPQAERCRNCSGKQRSPKIDWPAVEDLILMVQEGSFAAVAKELGVTDNAVRKHILTSGHNIPRKRKCSEVRRDGETR